MFLLLPKFLYQIAVLFCLTLRRIQLTGWCFDVFCFPVAFTAAVRGSLMSRTDFWQAISGLDRKRQYVSRYSLWREAGWSTVLTVSAYCFFKWSCTSIDLFWEVRILQASFSNLNTGYIQETLIYIHCFPIHPKLIIIYWEVTSVGSLEWKGKAVSGPQPLRS